MGAHSHLVAENHHNSIFLVPVKQSHGCMMELWCDGDAAGHATAASGVLAWWLRTTKEMRYHISLVVLSHQGGRWLVLHSLWKYSAGRSGDTTALPAMMMTLMPHPGRAMLSCIMQPWRQAFYARLGRPRGVAPCSTSAR
jgi:hypothetical protein